MAIRAAVLVLVTSAAYWPARSAPFLFDDQTAIVNNPTIRSLTPLFTVLSPPRDTPVAGRPLVNLTFAINYAIDGLNPRGYRLVNLAVHVLAGLVLFLTVRRVLGLPRVAPRLAAHATDVAFATALLWTLHPLHTEVVNYVTQRTEALMGLFYLLTVYCSVRAVDGDGRRWTAAASGACVAGMLCKESMVTAPIAVLLIDRILVFDGWRSLWHGRRALYVGFGAAWGVLLAVLATAPRSSAGFGSGTSAWVYLLNQASVITHYLALSFWPRNLVLDYGLPAPLGIGDVVVPGLLVLTLLIASVAALAYRPQLGLLGAWFFLTLAPTSSVVPISTEVGAERRMYLPLVALVLLVVVAMFSLLVRTPIPAPAAPSGPKGKRRSQASSGRSPSPLPVSAFAGLAVIAALMVTGVVVRGREYASPLVMARTIVDRWPNGRGHFLLGTALIEAGRGEEGMSELRASARDYPGALFAIATEQLGAGQFPQAIETIQRFLQLLPNHVNAIPARDLLARAYAAGGNMAAAEEQARELVRLAPRYAPGHDLLARLRAGRGDYQGAIAEFQQLLAIEPGNLEAQRNLAALQRLAAGNR